jgi:hypothetical protein
MCRFVLTVGGLLVSLGEIFNCSKFLNHFLPGLETCKVYGNFGAWLVLSGNVLTRSVKHFSLALCQF